MTTALPTRPKYAREHLTFSDREIAEFIEDGAKVFGEIVVAKVDGRTIAIRPSQVVKVTEAHIQEVIDCSEARFDHEEAPTMPQVLAYAKEMAIEERDEDNAAEATLADQDAYEAKADALGISVGELTDGEYEDRRITVASRAARLDALAAKWA